MNNISSLLSEIIQAPDATDNTFFGVVTSVDAVEKTCSVRPYNSTSEVAKVRLIAQSDEADQDVRQGFALVPKSGSVVMVVMESDTEGFVGLFSQLESVEWKGKTGNEVQSTVKWEADNLAQEVKGATEKVLSKIDVASTGIKHIVSEESSATEIDFLPTGYSQVTGDTAVDITTDGYNQVTGDTTVDVTTEGYSQVTGDTTIDITTDGYSQTTGSATIIKFEEKITIKNEESLKDILIELLDAMENLTVPTGVGPSGKPILAPEFGMSISTKINNLFEN